MALRVTADPATAEDVAQDCFFKLTQKADEINDSLPGWLHRVSMNRAREVIRNESTRRRHEHAAAVVADSADAAEVSWSAIAPVLDAALDELPEELRAPLAGHYLCGQTQAVVAERLGINQGTVSRRIERGLTLVRDHLRKAGVAVPTLGGLATLLTTHAAEAAPTTLTQTLGKISLSGAAGSTTSATPHAAGGIHGLFAGKSVLAAHVRREGSRVWIDNVAPSKGDENGYMRGLETLLGHAGKPVPYERLMGLSGLAFITQVDTGHRWQGQVDAGWWPLDPWGLEMRRDFLARAVGYELKEVGAPLASHEWLSADKLPDLYRDEIQEALEQSIDAGLPAMTSWCGTDMAFGYVIAGYNDAGNESPIWGRCARSTDGPIYRCADWPYGVILLGERSEPLGTDEADLEALCHAVALSRDAAGPFDERWHDRRFTGQKAFAAWATLLRNMDEPVQGRGHANMKQNLRWQRTAAVAYLRGIAERHDGEAAEALEQAAATYETVLDRLSRIETRNLSDDPEARRQLADLIDEIAALEREAADHMDTAVTHLSPPS